MRNAPATATVGSGNQPGLTSATSTTQPTDATGTNVESSATNTDEQEAHVDAEATDDNAMDVDVDEENQDSDNLDVSAKTTGLLCFTFTLTSRNCFGICHRVR